MDFNPRWVSDAADFDLGRQRQNDWMAVIVGSLDDSPASTALYHWLGGGSLPPPVLLADGDAAAFAQQHGLHEANIWPLETPLRHAQMEALLRRASLAWMPSTRPVPRRSRDRPATARRSPRCTMIEQVAAFDTTVLVLGESGTGKWCRARSTSVRRAVMARSWRVHCGAIPPDLLESELFGHEGCLHWRTDRAQGPFRNGRRRHPAARRDRRHEPADAGEALRVLQERSFERVGGNQTIRCNVRVVAATHRDLETRIAEGKFREDLFYRLNVFPIEVPALRERREDLPALVETIAAQLPAPAVAKCASLPSAAGAVQLRMAGQRARADQPGRAPGGAASGRFSTRAGPAGPLPWRCRTGSGGCTGTGSYGCQRRTTGPAQLLVPRPAAATSRRWSTASPSIARRHRRPARRRHGPAQPHGQHRTGPDQRSTGTHPGRGRPAAQLLGLRRTTLVEKLRKYGIEREQAELAG